MAKYRFCELSTALTRANQTEEKGLHISTTNSKLGAIQSMNLLPGLTCSHDACCHCMVDGCYAVKNVFRCGYNYEKNSTLRAWAENTSIAFTDPEGLYLMLREYFLRNRMTIKLFRIHSSGDFFSVKYARIWYAIAKEFSDIRFLAFTKQWEVVREVPFYSLSNFSLVLSGWTGIDIPDDLREHYQCAWCNDGTESRIPDNAMQCPGSCEQCGLCWYLNEIKRDTVFTKH